MNDILNNNCWKLLDTILILHSIALYINNNDFITFTDVKNCLFDIVIKKYLMNYFVDHKVMDTNMGDVCFTRTSKQTVKTDCFVLTLEVSKQIVCIDNAIVNTDCMYYNVWYVC